MRGRLWLTYFTHIAESKRQKYPEEPWADPKLTAFMQGVMDEVGKKMNCYVARIRPEDKERSGEYLNIDAVFIDNAEYDLIKEKSEWDPFVIPRAVVELENNYNIEKISYCLWKILCVRAPIRVLICYQKGKNKVTSLKQHLENVIWQGSLMKGTGGDLLVIIGDDSDAGQTLSTTYFGDYFNVFEWRNDKLEKIEGLDWSSYPELY